MPQARKIGTIAAGASGAPWGAAFQAAMVLDRVGPIAPVYPLPRATRCGEMPDPRGPSNHLSILKRAAYPEK